MNWWDRLRRTLSTQTDTDIDDEPRFHVEARVDDLMRDGFAEDAARRTALRQFGNVAAIHDRVRDRNVLRWMEDTCFDLRLA